MPNDSGWTVDTLREHLQRQLDDQKDAVATALAAAEKAVDKALISAEKAVDKADAASRAKFADQNEFRDQLKDQAANFLTRNEYHSNHEALRARIEGVETRMNLTAGKSLGMSSLVGLAFGIIAAVAAIVVIANILTSR